jgi:hypothetical protein
MTTTEIKAVVIDADGHFGDSTTVWFVGTVAQCRSFAKRGNCQILAGCEKSKGDKIKRGVLADMVGSGAWKIV